MTSSHTSDADTLKVALDALMAATSVPGATFKVFARDEYRAA